MDDRRPMDDHRLSPDIYNELRELAQRRLARESGDDLPQPTSIVHDVYLQLCGRPGAEPAWHDDRHFFFAAALVMRRLLVNLAIQRKRRKLALGQMRVHLTSIAGQKEPSDLVDLEMLDHALDKLAMSDQQKTDIVLLRFFAGLTIAQTALAMGIPERTVEREWTRTRAWLISELGASDAQVMCDD